MEVGESHRPKTKKRPGRKPTGEATLRKILELHRGPGKLPMHEIAKKAKVSLATVQRTLMAHRQGLLDADGLRTMPLFPEVFQQALKTIDR